MSRWQIGIPTDQFPVDLATLSAQQLSQVKKQLDDEVQHLSSSYQNLKNAQQKFRQCIKNVQDGVAESTKGGFVSALPLVFYV